MFERFTDRSRQAVVLSQEWARSFVHDQHAPEHLLLGLISEEQGVAAQALRSMNVTINRVSEQIAELAKPRMRAPTGHIPFTPELKKALENSLREALQLGHNYIGTEHLLLGLIRDREGPACEVLARLGVRPEDIRARVIELLFPEWLQAQPVKPAPSPRPPLVRKVEPAAVMREVVRRAEAEARVLRHGYIGTERLFLGLLLAEPQAPPRAGDLLDESVTVDLVRDHVAALTGRGAETRRDPRLTDEAADALELACCAAQNAGDHEVAPCHLLLALAGARRSLAFRLMTDFGLPERAAAQLRDLETGPRAMPERDRRLLTAVAGQGLMRAAELSVTGGE